MKRLKKWCYLSLMIPSAKVWAFPQLNYNFASWVRESNAPQVLKKAVVEGDRHLAFGNPEMVEVRANLLGYTKEMGLHQQLTSEAFLDATIFNEKVGLDEVSHGDLFLAEASLKEAPYSAEIIIRLFGEERLRSEVKAKYRHRITRALGRKFSKRPFPFLGLELAADVVAELAVEGTAKTENETEFVLGLTPDLNLVGGIGAEAVTVGHLRAKVHSAETSLAHLKGSVLSSSEFIKRPKVYLAYFAMDGAELAFFKGDVKLDVVVPKIVEAAGRAIFSERRGWRVFRNTTEDIGWQRTILTEPQFKIKRELALWQQTGVLFIDNKPEDLELCAGFARSYLAHHRSPGHPRLVAKAEAIEQTCISSSNEKGWLKRGDFVEGA